MSLQVFAAIQLFGSNDLASIISVLVACCLASLLVRVWLLVCLLACFPLLAMSDTDKDTDDMDSGDCAAAMQLLIDCKFVVVPPSQSSIGNGMVGRAAAIPDPKKDNKKKGKKKKDKKEKKEKSGKGKKVKKTKKHSKKVKQDKLLKSGNGNDKKDKDGDGIPKPKYMVADCSQSD